MITLLEAEIERLQASLETFRLTDHPQRRQIIGEHVAALDERIERLDELRLSQQPASPPAKS
jgi:uncharacterized small protein (DUF1192 family)